MSRYIIRENEGTEVSNNPRIFDIVVNGDDEVYDNVVTAPDQALDHEIIKDLLAENENSKITLEIKAPSRKKVELDLLAVLRLGVAAMIEEKKRQQPSAEKDIA